MTVELKQLVTEAAELLSAWDAVKDTNYREGVIDLASVLAFPTLPLAVSNALFATAMAEHAKGGW